MILSLGNVIIIEDNVILNDVLGVADRHKMYIFVHCDNIWVQYVLIILVGNLVLYVLIVAYI